MILKQVTIKTYNILSVLMDKLCETKLDETFSDNLFITKGYKMERKDRNARRGGGGGGRLMVFYRSDLPVWRIKNFECEESSSIFLELKLKKQDMEYPLCLQTSFNKRHYVENDLTTKLDQILVKYDHICVIGDLNYNFLISDKSHTL